MTDPAGSDRIQQDVPTASGTGDDSSTGGDVARATTAGPSGEVAGPSPRSGGGSD